MCTYSYYIVRLNGTSLDEDFRGFIIQARTVEDNTPVGSFNDRNSYHLACTNNVRMVKETAL